MCCVWSIFHDLRFAFVCSAVLCSNLSLGYVTELIFGVYFVDSFKLKQLSVLVYDCCGL